MKVKEFKIHLLRGIMRPEYFYIPILKRKDETLPIRFKFTDEFGDDIFISQFVLNYNTYALYHDRYLDESGNWQYTQDEYQKGYTFEEDCEWRFPVPDPSQYEVYPVPDLTAFDIKVKNGSIEKGNTTVQISFDEPQTLAEIENLPAGIYYVGVPLPSAIVYFRFYPGYYTEEYAFEADDSIPAFDPQKEWHKGDIIAANGTIYVCQYDYKPGDPISSNLFRAKKADYPILSNNQYGMIDRSGKFSGYYRYDVYNTVSPYGQLGYNFYGITKKFENNTMPVVGYYKMYTLTLNKTNDYSKKITGVTFRLHSDNGDLGSIYMRYVTYISRTDNDITFKTASDSYAVSIQYLKVNTHYTLTEVEIPEGFRGYTGDVGFQFTKEGDLTCNVQNEYVSCSGSTLNIKNKRLKHRVKMVLKIIDNPQLPGGYTREQKSVCRCGAPADWYDSGMTNEPLKMPLQIYPNVQVKWPIMYYAKQITDAYPGHLGEGVYEPGTCSYDLYRYMQGNKCVVAEIYLDDEYIGYYTDIYMETSVVTYDEDEGASLDINMVHTKDNWNTAGGNDVSAKDGITVTAAVVTPADNDYYHQFSGSTNLIAENAYYDPGLYVITHGYALGTCLLDIGICSYSEAYTDDVFPTLTGVWWLSYTNRRRLYQDTVLRELDSTEINYNGGSSAGMDIYMKYRNTTVVNGETTKDVNNDTSTSMYFRIDSMISTLRYYEEHPDELVTVDSRGAVTTRFFGEGLTSEKLSEILAIVNEEDMDVELG